MIQCCNTVCLTLQGRGQRGHRVDGQVCGEESAAAPETEGHHMRSWQGPPLKARPPALILTGIPNPIY